jgi:hypothetical protein
MECVLIETGNIVKDNSTARHSQNRLSQDNELKPEKGYGIFDVIISS